MTIGGEGHVPSITANRYLAEHEFMGLFFGFPIYGFGDSTDLALLKCTI